MFEVSVNDVLRAAKAGRESGMLAAFHPEFQDLGKRQLECTYRYPGKPGVACAIGAGFTDEQAKSLTSMQNGDTIANLVGHGVVTVTGGRTRTLQSLQAKHDAILNARSQGHAGRTAKAVISFDAYLDKQLAKIAA